MPPEKRGCSVLEGNILQQSNSNMKKSEVCEKNEETQDTSILKRK